MTGTGARDYAAEMRARIDSEIDAAKEPYEPRVAATKLVARLRESDPGLLTGWLNAQAEQIVWQHINDRDRSRRHHERRVGSRSVFGKAAADYSSGDDRALSGWLTVPFTVESGVRKALANMTAKDLRFVANDYQRSADESGFEAAFFRALATKVGDRTVHDCFTSEQIAALRASIARIQGDAA